MTLEIEVNEMPGKGEIKLTGQLGDVMKESAMTGISYIRSVSRKYDIPNDYFETHDLHIHIPEGAVPRMDQAQVSRWRQRSYLRSHTGRSALILP